ncbi:MAG: hypothetical protein IJ583_13290 [Firmicutes bacterium]|nr:hypothetical protein [Bacillota bacterium]
MKKYLKSFLCLTITAAIISNISNVIFADDDLTENENPTEISENLENSVIDINSMTAEEQEAYENELLALDAVDATTDRVWNFSDSAFDLLPQSPDRIENNYFTVDGLLLKASNNKYMELMPTDKNFYGNVYTRYLNLEGQATGDTRKVEFMTYGDADIYILARGSNAATGNSPTPASPRFLHVEKSSTAGTLGRREVGGLYGTGLVSGYSSTYSNNTAILTGPEDSPKMLMYEYRGNGDKITLYSDEGGINIFGIAVKSRVNQDDEATINRRWHISDFDDVAFNRTNTVSQDDLYMTGYVSTYVDGEEKNGFDYNKCLNLGGRAGVLSTVDEGEIYFDVPGVIGEDNETTDIYVAARGDCKLQLVDEFGILWGEEQLSLENSDVEVHKFKYSGPAARLYLRVNDQEGRVYDIYAKTREASGTINKNWNISSSLFNNLGYSDNIRTVDGLTILKRINVASKNASYNNVNYTHMLAIGGKGVEDDRGIKFDVPGRVRVKIVAQSSSSARNIVLTDMSGYNHCSAVVNDLGEYEFTYNEDIPTSLYIRSLSGGFYIYNISVESIN